MAGITFTHLYQTANSLLSKRAQDSLHYLKHQVGTEWIALNPFAYQPTFDDPNIYLEGDPPDAHLRHAIREARRLEAVEVCWVACGAEEAGAVASRAVEADVTVQLRGRPPPLAVRLRRLVIRICADHRKPAILGPKRKGQQGARAAWLVRKRTGLK